MEHFILDFEDIQYPQNCAFGSFFSSASFMQMDEARFFFSS